MSEEFEIGSVAELQRKYGLFAENRPQIKLDPDRVPELLRHLIPLAEQFAVADDIMRADLRQKLSPSALQEIENELARHEDDLDEWLAGPEADSPHPSDEYVAFSVLRMLTDGC